MKYLRGQALDEHDEYFLLVKAYLVLSHGRGYAASLDGLLELPIKLSEIKVYIDLHNITFISDFIEIIQLMDLAYLRYRNNGEDITQPPKPLEMDELFC